MKRDAAKMIHAGKHTAGALRAAVAILAVMYGLPVAGDEILFNFDKNFETGKMVVYDAKADVVSNSLRVASQHNWEWPCVRIPAPRLKWDLSKHEYLSLDAKNIGTNAAIVCCRVDNAGADGNTNCVTGAIKLEPGETNTLKMTLKRQPPNYASTRLFGMRGYPQEIIGGMTGTIDCAEVVALLIFVPKPKEDHLFEIRNIRVGGKYVPPPPVKNVKSAFPFIDTFGQYVHRDWPGKTHSLEELKGRVEPEKGELAGKPGPANWNQYGGWKDGPSLKATGFFRTEKHDGKWWLVDPEGKLFWSHGVDCVTSRAETPIENRASWFKDYPGNRQEFKECAWSSFALLGCYKGRTIPCFDFGSANLIRKYGSNWPEKNAETTHKRLRSWGMNTIGNWSDDRICLQRKTPYMVGIHPVGKPIRGSSGYWQQFMDPFEPDFGDEVLKKLKSTVGKAAGDPWCIGYFVHNELTWGDDTYLALASLSSPYDQASKRAFVVDLKTKYDKIADLNAAWATNHVSWEALQRSTQPPDKEKARADLAAFSGRIAEQYFRLTRESVREFAPNQLYLGCRFAKFNDVAALAAARFCDAVSVNVYLKDVSALNIPDGLDAPVIIGEFHFGALDRGMFHPGLCGVTNQVDRAAAYRSYVRGALRQPLIVGSHWFQYRDEATTGRSLDEENYQVGLVDVCDTPYPETIEAVRDTGYSLYEIRSRKD